MMADIFPVSGHCGLRMITSYCLRGSKIVADQCEDVMEELLLVLVP